MTVPTNNEEAERIAKHVRKIARYEGITEGQASVLRKAADILAARRLPVSGDNQKLIDEAQNYRGDNGTQRWPSLIVELATALSASQPREVQITDAETWSDLQDGIAEEIELGGDASTLVARVREWISHTSQPREVRTVEWGVQFPSVDVWTAHDEHEARYEAESFGGVVMTRGVGPWLPVTPSTPNQQGAER